jgi:allantoicase
LISIIIELSLLVYPNPFTGILQWRITGEHSDGVITITDVMGKHIKNETITANKKEGSIDLSALTQGVYMIHYSDKEFVTTKKIIKQ